MPAKDAPVIDAMRRLSAQFPRFGYRRIHVYLEREGHTMGWTRRIDSGARLGCRCHASARAGGYARMPPM
jgi:hypothetical protein